MKEHNFNEIKQKYLEGESTLQEEKALFEEASKEVKSLNQWATFVNQNKKTAPVGLNEKLWDAFEEKQFKKPWYEHEFFYAAAAAAIILVALFNFRPMGMSTTEKEMLLNQALEMVSDAETSQEQHDVVYENDMIVIYTTTE